jgi:hypothetical protein
LAKIMAWGGSSGRIKPLQSEGLDDVYWASVITSGMVHDCKEIAESVSPDIKKRGYLLTPP